MTGLPPAASSMRYRPCSGLAMVASANSWLPERMRSRALLPKIATHMTT